MTKECVNMSKKSNNLRPPLKWVGGKRQLIPEIEKHFPKKFTRYYEPFVGGGAILFHFQPKRAVINDYNEELINYYRVVKEDVEALITELSKDIYVNKEENFYAIRELDRSVGFKNLSPVKRAARIQYLNKTCYNGLYRVNSSGQFNVPFGRYKNPDILSEDVLRSVSDYFNANDIKIMNGDFEESLKYIRSTAFVYFDPPYDPISESANFTAYSSSGFDKNDQVRLKKVCDQLDKKGVKFLLSNSSSDFIMDLYKDYRIIEIPARRSINSKGDKRGPVMEVLVKNYD